MGGRTKRIVVVVGLVLVSALLLGSGALWRLAPWLGPPAAWRADRVAEVSVAEDGAVTNEELLIRLNTANAEMRRRLEEYAEIEGSTEAEPARTVLRRARVVARSRRASRHHLRIDAGVYEGVRRDMAVVVGWSLVGVVVGEAPGTSLVRLVTDTESRIPVHLVSAPGLDENGEPLPAAALALGVCAGTGEADRLEILFVEDRPDLLVEPGMSVVSAGGPGVVPPGLVLGTVQEAARAPHSDHWVISAAPLRRGDLVASVLLLRAPSVAHDEER
ncbi:MAG: hypothetical protein PF961_09045 [Planctomycetota bacterium]|nr:hypothetical protein [Planctomycetota bacterium]